MTLVPAPRRIKSVWTAVILAAGALLLLCAFVPIQQTITGACALSPACAWTLEVVREGTYESKAWDFASGQILHYRLYQFDRPAFLEMDISQLATGVHGGELVEAGSTVARMQSSSLSIELAERSTALEEARGRLGSLLSTAKPEEIARAQVALERAQAAREGYRPHFERQQRLHEQGAIDDSVWDENRAQMHLLELDVSLAQAELKMLASDDRPAYITEAEMSIAALEQELRTVESMLSAQEIKTPIAGKLRTGSESDTLLIVSGLETMIAQIMLPQRQAHLPAAGQHFKAYVPGTGSTALAGTIVRVDRRAEMTQAGSFVMVYGTLDNSAGLLEEGMEGRARIYCGKVPILSRVWRDIVRALRQEFWPA